ncbi:MAG: PilZ domain-containing protein [Syntrophorhabdaceae bacterium]|nr:PilZ domain-containing protein [Syntrophorhabdaceae bacterium]
MENKERREFFRIDDRLTLKFRLISEEEFKILENIVRLSPSSTLTNEDEISILKKIELDEEKNRDPLYTYLKIIDRKLDLILDILSERADDTKIYTTGHIDVNLSASGIRFQTEAPMKNGDFVELIIILPVYPLIRISALCRVIRCDSVTIDGQSKYEVSLHYVVINENDRDRLIRYILIKEREMLRVKRDTTG